MRLEVVLDGVHLVQLVTVEFKTLLSLCQEVLLSGQEVRDHLVDSLPVFEFLRELEVVLSQKSGGLVHFGQKLPTLGRTRNQGGRTRSLRAVAEISFP